MKKLRGFLSRNKRAIAGAVAVMVAVMVLPVAAHAGASTIASGAETIATEIQKWGKWAGIIGLVMGVALTYMSDSEGPGRKIGYAMLFLGIIGSVAWIVSLFGVGA